MEAGGFDGGVDALAGAGGDEREKVDHDGLGGGESGRGAFTPWPIT